MPNLHITLRQIFGLPTNSQTEVIVDGQIRHMTTRLELCQRLDGKGFQFVDLDYGIVHPTVYASVDDASKDLTRYILV